MKVSGQENAALCSSSHQMVLPVPVSAAPRPVCTKIFNNSWIFGSVCGTVQPGNSHPFQWPLQCLIPLHSCLKPSKCLLFQHVRWRKSWEMNRFHHSEEATWSRDAGQATGASAACRSPWLCPGSRLCGHAVTGRKSHAALYTCT